MFPAVIPAADLYCQAGLARSGCEYGDIVCAELVAEPGQPFGDHYLQSSGSYNQNITVPVTQILLGQPYKVVV